MIMGVEFTDKKGKVYHRPVEGVKFASMEVRLTVQVMLPEDFVEVLVIEKDLRSRLDKVMREFNEGVVTGA